jgi:hypothetical protein
MLPWKLAFHYFLASLPLAFLSHLVGFLLQIFGGESSPLKVAALAWNATQISYIASKGGAHNSTKDIS